VPIIRSADSRGREQGLPLADNDSARQRQVEALSASLDQVKNKVILEHGQAVKLRALGAEAKGAARPAGSYLGKYVKPLHRENNRGGASRGPHHLARTDIQHASRPKKMPIVLIAHAGDCCFGRAIANAVAAHTDRTAVANRVRTFRVAGATGAATVVAKPDVGARA